MHRKAVKILEAKIGIQSNSEECLLRFPLSKEVDSLLTDFHRVEKHPFSSPLDGLITIQEIESEPSFVLSKNEILFKGPFLRMDKNASDRRFTFWGNQGFLYRYALYLLEKRHRIYNLHACALYDEDKDVLYVITGGEGAGKTVFLLRGLEEGLRLFSTETVHVRIENNNTTWFKGPLLDNIRWGTLASDFPMFLPREKTIPPKKAWSKKVALDLSAFQSSKNTISNPKEVHIIFARIEERQKPYLYPLEDRREAVKKLFDNISQKLAETVVLFDSLPVLGLDEDELAKQRLTAVDCIVGHPTIKRIISVLSNPRECWKNLSATEEET